MNLILPPKDFNFTFSIRTSCRIKVIDHHPCKPWVCYTTQNNIIQIWDYNLKNCIKSFHDVKIQSNNPNNNNIEKIDLQKSFDIKTIKFFDKNTLFWLFPNCREQTQVEEQIVNNFKNNWIIIQAEQKVIFYDYILDEGKVISPYDLEQKSVRCMEILDHQYLALGCSDGCIKIFDIQSWNFVKTMKGYPKNISFMVAHKQNQGNRPRLIVANQDGQLNCWNADTNIETPAFKFVMIKKGKAIMNSNDGQEVLGMCLDHYQHRLVTITEDYITVWSSLAGTEIKRFKNTKGNNIRGVSLLNHPSYSVNCFSVFTRDSEVFVIDVEEPIQSLDQNKLPILQFKPFYDLKSNQELDRRIQILCAQHHQVIPNLLFFGTTFGFFVITLNKYVTPNISFNYIFTSNLTPDQTNEFVKSTGEHKNITAESKNKLRQYEENQAHIINFMYVSVQDKNIFCNLIDSNQDVTHQYQPKSIIYEFQTFNFQWDESELHFSLSGKYCSILNKENGYYEILKVDNSHIIDKDRITNLCMEGENREETLQFLSKLRKVHQGLAIEVVWHQYRDEFATLSPKTKNNEFIDLIEKTQVISTGSFFSKKSYTKHYQELTHVISKIALCVFSFEYLEGHQKKPQLIMETTKFMNPTKLFGQGDIYCVVDLAMDNDINEILVNPTNRRKEAFRMHKFNKAEFFDVDRTNKKYVKIGQPIIEPIKIFWSLSSEVCIAVYTNFFCVFRYDHEQNNLTAFKTANYQVIDGYFWENIFFFTNEKSIYMVVQDFIDEILVIELANLEYKLKQNYIFNYEEIFGIEQDDKLYDTIYPEIQKKPPGTLKIMSIYNQKLAVINQNKELGYIELDHPFINFCMNFQLDKYDQCHEIIKQFDPTIHYIFVGMFMYRQAYDEIENIEGLSIIDKAIIKFEFSHTIDQQHCDMIFNTGKNNTEQKQQLLSYFITKLHQQDKQQEADQLYQYGLSKNLLSKNSGISMLVQNEELQLIGIAKSCGNLIVPYLLQKNKEKLTKDKNYKPYVEAWIDQMCCQHLNIDLDNIEQD